jgi:WD40 repeat protein
MSNLPVNLIAKRRTDISKYLNNYLPIDLSKLVSEYDYYLEGKSYTLIDNNDHKSYTDFITSIAVIPDEREFHLICGYQSGIIKIWNLKSGTCEELISEKFCPVHNIIVLHDRRIIGATENGTLNAWNVKTNEWDIIIEDHSLIHLSCIAELPNNCIVVTTYNTLKIWDLQTQKCNITLTGHIANINCIDVILFSDGQEFCLITGSNDTTLKVWDLKTGKCHLTFSEHQHWINCVKVLPDSSYRIVSGSSDNTIKIWSPITGDCYMTFMEYHDAIQQISTILDGRIISNSFDGTFKIWNPFSGKCDITFLDSECSDSEFFENLCPKKFVVLPDGRIVTRINKGFKIWS